MNISNEPPKKMEELREKIKTLLREYDAMGVVIVADPGGLSFVHHFGGTWSCCSTVNHPERGGFMLRIKTARSEYPTLEAQKHALEETIGSLIGIHHVAENLVEALGGVIAELGKQMIIENVMIDVTERKKP